VKRFNGSRNQAAKRFNGNGGSASAVDHEDEGPLDASSNEGPFVFLLSTRAGGVGLNLQVW
jgi:SNF2 family DNA or RNA helicase